MYTSHICHTLTPSHTIDVPDLVGGVIPLTFDENINMATIPISILNDNINEVLERFIARLTTSDEDVILMPDEAIVEIRDNDCECPHCIRAL